MSLAKIYKHYKITPQKLKEFLDGRGMSVDLRFVKQIPEEWLSLLSEETGIGKLELDKILSSSELLIEEEKKIVDSKTNLESDKKEIPVAINHFLAYVKFVAEDKSHAFVRIFEGFNTIYDKRLDEKSVNDYRITKNCDQLDFGQIIICKLHKNLKNVEIVTPYFNGFFKINKKRNYNNHNGSTYFYQYFFSIKNKGFESVIEVRNVKDSVAYEFTTKILFFQRRKFYVKTAAIDFKLEEYLLQVKDEAAVLLQLDTIDIKFIDTISLLKTNISMEDFENVLKEQFNKDLLKKSYFIDESAVQSLIDKWQFLRKDWLTISNLEQTPFWNYYFKLWIDNNLPLIFWEDKIVVATIKYLESLEEREQEVFFKIIVNQRKRVIYIEPLKNYLKNYFTINTSNRLKIIQGLTKVVFQHEADHYVERIEECLSDELKFELWIENKSKILPKQYALTVFGDKNAIIQAEILKNLNDYELLALLPSLKLTEDTACNERLLTVSNKIIEKQFPSVCFDLETDRESIFELAWFENEENFVYKSTSVNDGLYQFKSIVSECNKTLVGHNIIDFDCVVLEKQGFVFDKELLWDTFLMEMLLSPELKNFALKTKHIAELDVMLTLDLFYNQVLRILCLSEQSMKLLMSYLPSKTKAILSRLKEDYSWDWLNCGMLENEKLTFFRPQPQEDALMEKINTQITQNNSVSTIFLVPERYKSMFYSVENVRFSSFRYEKDFGYIDLSKVKVLGNVSSWVSSCLTLLVANFEKKKLKPYWGSLAIAIQLRIEQELNDVFSILTFDNDLTTATNNNLVVDCNEFYTLRNQLSIGKNTRLTIVYKSLLLLDNKTSLKTVTVDELIGIGSSNHFWIKFNGGQSFVAISIDECRKLTNEIPEYFDNFWIEKFDFANFRVWGNYNIEKMISEILFESISTIDLEEPNEEEPKLFFSKTKPAINCPTDFLRLNPETNYRTRYWLFQKEIVLRITEPNVPNLLVIQNRNEISGLENYFRSIGFYIPAREASWGRRMELVHQNRSVNKMVVIAIEEYERAIESNYLDDLTIIIDSLNLFENYYLAKNSSLFAVFENENILETAFDELEIDSDASEIVDEQSSEIIVSTPLIKDFYFHVKLQKPFVRFLKNKASQNFVGHKLWLIDSRINEYNEISDLWNAKSTTFVIGENFNFDKELLAIENYIEGVRPLSELPFGLEQTKLILSDIFLNGGVWYDYQIPFLDDIIPAKEDILVNLPTGGGKSLLFQGPALLRSAFTNKLTIVVTPLKALMQDQVEALWNKGFYGNVDYLNSDRGSDTQIIYRSLAGGELSLLFITPERFRSRSFKNALNIRMKADGGLEYAVFDEAHCVSQWGHEFRPDYFNSAKEINYLKKMSTDGFPLLLFSATVSKKIYEDFNTIFS